MKDVSIEGIYDTLKQCAQIFKFTGGIGVAVSSICATGSYIRGSNGLFYAIWTRTSTKSSGTSQMAS